MILFLIIHSDPFYTLRFLFHTLTSSLDVSSLTLMSCCFRSKLQHTQKNLLSFWFYILFSSSSNPLLLFFRIFFTTTCFLLCCSVIVFLFFFVSFYCFSFGSFRIYVYCCLRCCCCGMFSYIIPPITEGIFSEVFTFFSVASKNITTSSLARCYIKRRDCNSIFDISEVYREIFF